MIKKLSFILAVCMSAQSALALDAQKGDEITMKLIISDKEYNVVLEQNDTASALQQMLPLTLNMSDLNNNEKYYYLAESLPSNSEQVGSISTGDIMLFGDDCLVVFYKDFETSYSYTRIGRIQKVDGLDQSLGFGNVEITLKK